MRHEFLKKTIVSRRQDENSNIARCHCSTFSWTSHAKPEVLESFLEDPCPKMVSKPSVSCETSLKNSKKTLHQSAPTSRSIDFYTESARFGTHPTMPTMPRRPPKGSTECGWEPPFLTRLRFKLTVVPTNSLK